MSGPSGSALGEGGRLDAQQPQVDVALCPVVNLVVNRVEHDGRARLGHVPKDVMDLAKNRFGQRGPGQGLEPELLGGGRRVDRVALLRPRSEPQEAVGLGQLMPATAGSGLGRRSVEVYQAAHHSSLNGNIMRFGS